jgi:hypothetical protein
MNLELDREQRAQLELISMHVGKPPAQLLVEAALFLFDRNIESPGPEQGPSGNAQSFLGAAEVDERLARMLRR